MGNTLKPAMIFTDHMVLQRSKEIPVWGEAVPGAHVCVTLGLDTVSCRADAEGSWRVVLPAREAAEDLELVLSDGTETVTLCDVCVGEVWLAGGQSNMEFLLGFEKHFEEVIAGPLTGQIRFFDYPEVAYEGELSDFSYTHEGFWRRCTKEDIPYYSAVGYYFAEKLQKELGVPVGIVGCNWGGTPACAWLDPAYLRNTPGYAWVEDYEEAVKDLDVAAYQEAFLKNPGNDRTHQLNDPFNEKVLRDGLSKEEMDSMLELFAQAAPGGQTTAPVIGPWYERRPGGLYETMLKKVWPYAIRGVIWYQGESDCDGHPELYDTVFTQMIACWRDLWGEELPFLFVQLPGFGEWLGCSGEPFPIIRACQEKVSKSAPSVWMTSVSDAGMEWDIHPKDKKVVGERLALLAAGHVYHAESGLLCDAPEVEQIETTDTEIRITFSHGDGLAIRGDSLRALVGLTSSGKEIPLCRARTEGHTLIVDAVEPVVKLAFAKTAYYEVNLYNKAGIPAIPFERSI